MIGSRRALLRATRPFLLRDHFGKPAAAGSVNATPAVPGPGGLRTVTDTTNLMQVGPWKTGTRLADETTMSATFGAANNRCSYADGQAWVGFAGADFGNAGLTVGKWYLLVMQDSSSKLAYCYVKGGDVGAGEALGSELVTNGGFDSDTTGWAVTNCTISSVAGGQSGNCCELNNVSAESWQRCYQAEIIPAKKSIKVSVYVKSGTSGNQTALFQSWSGAYFNIGSVTTSADWRKIEGYISVSITEGLYLRKDSATVGTMLFDTVAAQEVTAPAATCLYAYKSVNGSQGWHMDGSFNMNATSYTYDIYELGETALVCAGGKSTGSAGDPGIWWPAVTRRLGLTMVVGPVTVVDAARSVAIGFDSSQAGSLLQAYYLEADTLCPYDSTAGSNIYTPLDNTPYYLAIRLLAAGAEYYLRTLTGYWKLLWRGGTNATATLYPGISGHSAAFTLSKPGIQLLPAPWNPSCLLYHDFAGDSDGAITTSEALDGDGVSAPVRTWLGTTATVSSSKMIVTPSLGAELVTNGTFDSDLTGWDLTPGADGSITWDSGQIYFQQGATSEYMYASQDITTTANLWYLFQATIGDSITPSGPPYWYLYAGTTQNGGQLYTGPRNTTNGTKTISFMATGTTTWVSLRESGVADTTSKWDNATVKPITFASTLNLSNLGTSDVLADCYVTALTTGTQAGLALCWDSESNPQNGLLVYYDGAGNIKLDKCVAGTWSNVASTAQAHSADARLRAVKDSTGVTIYFNDTIIGSTNSVTDAGIISNTLHGVFSTYEGNTFSKVHIMKRGALNEFRELDNYIH